MRTPVWSLNLKAKANLSYSNRLDMFLRKSDGNFEKEVQGAIDLARLTIMQSKLRSAIEVMNENLDDAKRIVNEQINPKALELSGIRPVRDVHKALWRMTGSILRNRPVEWK